MSDDALVLICGEESFLVDEEVRRWRERAAGTELSVEIFDQPAKLAALRQSLAEMPLFDPERVVIVRDPPQLSGNTRKGGDAVEGLIEALQGRAPTTAVCIVHHGALAPAQPIRAAIADMGGRIAEFARLRGRDLRDAAQRRVREAGLVLGAPSLDHLVAVSGGDLGVLAGEVTKLAAFANEGGRIAHEDVVALVAGDSPVEMWNVMEWLLGPSPGRGAAAVDALLAEGRAPQYMLISLAGQVRELIQARALLSEKRVSSAGLASALRLPSWRADRLERQARRLPGAVSVGWLRELQRIDAAGKAGEADDAESLRAFARRAAADVLALPR